jgi:putative glutamine amidotransferase
MTGGDDIHPRHWDEQEALDNRAEPDEERDALELPAVRRAWALGLPILGICRGEQLLNVALGGSLYQDLPRQLRLESALHRRGTSQVPELAHTVTLAPESRLAALTGLLEVAVNSRHHQAVLGVAPLLKAAAWHQGLVEGVEAVAPERWVVGVQWHPENLVGLEGPAGEAARAIFRGFNAALATR